MKNDGFTFRKRMKSFRYAFRGIYLLVRYEHNAWMAIKRTKDLAAGAVLILAMASATIGLLIFIPKL